MLDRTVDNFFAETELVAPSRSPTMVALRQAVQKESAMLEVVAP